MKANLIQALLSGTGKAMRSGGRAAGNVGRFLIPKDMGAGQTAMALLPDTAFGLMAAGMAPEGATLLDRGAMLGGSILGGGVGGLAAGGAYRKLAGKHYNQGIGTMVDLAGSFGGDMLGQQGAMAVSALGDKLSGGKGQDVYTRLSEKDRAAYEQMIQEQTLAAAGLIPAHPLHHLG